jgi:hypothetical protein
VGYRFDDWIYWTSLPQLHLIITAHTLNSFLITNLSLYFFWFLNWSLVSSRLLLRTTHGFSVTTNSWESYYVSFHDPVRILARTTCYSSSISVRIHYHGNVCSPKAVVQQRSVPCCHGNVFSEAPPPADGQVAAFRLHVTICNIHWTFYCTFNFGPY